MAEQKLLVKREGDFHYPIYFENDFKNLARALKEEGLDGRKICIVTDSHVAPLYLDSVKTILNLKPVKRIKTYLLYRNYIKL